MTFFVLGCNYLMTIISLVDRLALLDGIGQLFLKIADFSKLS